MKDKTILLIKDLLASLIFFMILISVFRFLFIDILILLNRASGWYWIALLLLTVMLSYFINREYKYKLYIYLLMLALAYIIFNLRIMYNNIVESKPFIREMNMYEVIQGDIVCVQGRGFGRVESPGEILIENTSLRIIKWGEYEVCGEVPVPDKYFKGFLYVKTKEKKSSNKIEIRVVNPSYVL